MADGGGLALPVTKDIVPDGRHVYAKPSAMIRTMMVGVVHCLGPWSTSDLGC